MTFPGPNPDELADRLLVKTLAAEVEQAKDGLARREDRLRKALDEAYDGYSPSHDERPEAPYVIPREHSLVKWIARIVIAVALVYIWRVM